MSRCKLGWIPAVALVVALGACDGQSPAPTESAINPPAPLLSSVTPTPFEGNSDCADFGYDYGFKIDALPVDGTYFLINGNQNGLDTELTGGGLDDPGNSVTISNATATTFDWTSTLGMDAVIVKAGNQGNLYKYDPESFGDTGLTSPANASGSPADISHVEFCYDYEVSVGKTANAGYTRDWDWQITKTGDHTELTLSAGQAFQVNYSVDVSVTGVTDSDWYVEGVITIDNATPFDATIESVTDVIADIGGTVNLDCGVTLPYLLAAGGSLSCDYDAMVAETATENPFGDLNTATVTTSGTVGGGEATAPIVFGDPTNPVDECVDVTDDKYGVLGTVCQDTAPANFQYSMNIGPYAECGEYEFVNIASYLGDGGEAGSNDWTVLVEVVGCGGDFGCTLTPGYWKTHSDYGPAPYDETWALLEDPDFFGPDTPFFLSGQTYYQVLWTQPRGGNAYYILARAWIAAYLNVLNGADIPTEVLEAWNMAKTGFETYTPAQVAMWKNKEGREKREMWIELAGILDDYNNGLTGPGHCSEDDLSAD